MGEVPGSQVPQHVVEQVDGGVHHLSEVPSLKLFVRKSLLNLGLDHVDTFLLLGRVGVDAKEVPLVLKAGRQSLVARLPVCRQLLPILQNVCTFSQSWLGCVIHNSHFRIRIGTEAGLQGRIESKPTSAVSNSLVAATCLTISLGFLATHLLTHKNS